ncbi:putative nuclease HARBI1 [Daphnia magna]|uniref:putative nuclease HARBI1 n=1 Tax=Daphnia magna TaxID=35525 RepID=UPI001403E991|nr:putative nuclease HARBI1 [Daphnia magna]
MLWISLQFYAAGSFQTVKNDFQEIALMPEVFGCIDGTHISIVRPKNHEKAYVNRKNYHSLNVQATCEANHRFLSKKCHVLHGEIKMSPTKASWITVDCCLLHNIAIDRKMPLDEDSIELEIDNVDNIV